MVMGTGTGKTVVAASVIAESGLRTLWGVHRRELVYQAARALEAATGERVGFEMPGMYSGSERVVVASVATIRSKARLERLRNFEPFGLIAYDEAHHSEARTYKVIADAYPNALRFLFTATAGRMDRRVLSLADAVTEPFGINVATEQGYLVPVVAKRDSIKSVDLSGVGTVAGDFDRQQLSAIMGSEANLHAVAKAILDRQANWPGLLFSPAVDVAERTAEIINRYRPGTARFVSGKTPDNERAGLFADLGKTYQVLANYGVVTEGNDLVNIRSVFVQRPTKSTGLFQQMLGRGLRPLPGLVDDCATAVQRKEAIQGSSKPHCLVVDFVGVTGRHSVATAIDVLATGPGCEGPVLERIRTRLEQGDTIDAGTVAEEIEAYQERRKAKEARQARDLAATGRAAIVGTVQLSSRDVKLIGLGGTPDGRTDLGGLWDGPPLPGQVDELQRLGIVPGKHRTAREARQAIASARERNGLATAKQVLFVQKHKPNLYRPGLSKRQAAQIIGQTMRGWHR